MARGVNKERQAEATSNKQLLDELGVDAMARNDAKAGIPRQNDTELTLSEQSVIEHFRNRARKERNDVKDEFDDYKAQMSEIYHSRILEELNGLPEELRRHNSDSRQKEEQDFIALREEAESRELAVKSFAQKNCLTREPQPQDSPMQTTFWIAAIVLLETTLNATFFAVGSDRGLLGGAIQAFVISFLNVMAAWFLGRLSLPQLNSCKPEKKYIGAGCAVLLVAGIFMLNMFAGHYRSALEEDAFKAVLMAVKSFSENILSIKSAQGWLLSAVGGVAFSGLTTKLYMSDDPYPGYGKIYRQYLHVRDAWIQRQREFTETIIENYASVEKKRASSTDRLTKLEVGYGVLLDKIARVAEFYEGQLSRQQSTCNKIINHYRELNKYYRKNKNEPMPVYFSQPVLIGLPDFDLAMDLDKEREHHDELVAKFEAYRSNDSARIKKELDEIHSDEIQNLDRFFGNV